MKITKNKTNTLMALVCLGSLLIFFVILFEISIASPIFLFIGSILAGALMIIGFLALFKLSWNYKGWIISIVLVTSIFIIVVRYLIVSGILLKIGIALIGFLVGIGLILYIVENSVFIRKL